MGTIVVGDLHGQLEIARAALALGERTIFIGDYLDSFTASVEDQVETLRFVLDAVKDGQAQALYGNHELSYLREDMACSGFKAVTKAHVMHMDLAPLQEYIWEEGFLLSHAGVSDYLLEVREQTLEEYLEAREFYQIGGARGGLSHCGGLFWCDWRYEFEPVEGVKQIVGHTRGDSIREKHGNYCIDVIEDMRPNPQVVRIEDGELELVRLQMR